MHTEFDPGHGGFGGAPKFPQAPVLDALLVRTDPLGNDRVLFTLESMACGGLHDQVGGGFHRYCVDADWGGAALREDALRQCAAARHLHPWLVAGSVTLVGHESGSVAWGLSPRLPACSGLRR